MESDNRRYGLQKGMEESVKMDGVVWLGDGGWGWLGVEVEVCGWV